MNKDGFINMSLDEPTRGKGKWIYKEPYVNSLVFDFAEGVVDQNCLSFDDDPEPISMNMIMSKN